MILRINLEIETEGMTLLQLASTVDAIKHLAGLKGRVKCRLPRTPREVDIDELVAHPTGASMSRVRPVDSPLHPGVPTVPCETCGTPTPMTGTKRCDGCWEVEHRLRGYLRTGGAKARTFVMDALLFWQGDIDYEASMQAFASSVDREIRRFPKKRKHAKPK